MTGGNGSNGFRSFPPSFRLAGLWERTSEAGATWFAGRLGGCRVALVPNRQRQGDHEPSHWLMISDGGPPAQPRVPLDGGTADRGRNAPRTRGNGAPAHETPSPRRSARPTLHAPVRPPQRVPGDFASGDADPDELFNLAGREGDA